MAVISLKLRKMYLFTVSNSNAFRINFRRKNRGSILTSLFLFTSTTTLLLTPLPKASLLTPYRPRRRIGKHVRQYSRGETNKTNVMTGKSDYWQFSVRNHPLTGLATNQQTAGTALKCLRVFENDRTLSATLMGRSMCWECSSEMRHCPNSVIYSSHALTKLHAGLGTTAVTWLRKNVTSRECIPTSSQLKGTINMRRLTTEIRCEKCVVRRFRRCANVYLHKCI